jgi:hypothetical protein
MKEENPSKNFIVFTVQYITINYNLLLKVAYVIINETLNKYKLFV